MSEKSLNHMREFHKCCVKFCSYRVRGLMCCKLCSLSEGQSGTSVASFFVLLRWLCALNLFLALLILFVVIIPQVPLSLLFYSRPPPLLLFLLLWSICYLLYQAVFGHGLDVPPSVRENGTALSFLIDGKVYTINTPSPLSSGI